MEQTAWDVSHLYSAWRVNPTVKIVFQALVHIPSGKPFGFEALSRPQLHHQSMPIGLLLESASLANQLSDFDRVALPEILRTATALRFPSSLKLFINLSPFTLLDPDFVFSAFQSPDINVKPSQVVIEISERESLPGIDLEQLLIPYRQAGMSIALDDFGAGYSGLNRVVDLDPDYAKIDLNLVRDIDKNPVKYALVESTVQFAGRSGHLQLLAEGIEKSTELATLYELGVTLGQGFLLGKPQSRLQSTPHGVSLDLLQRRIPDAYEQLQAFLTASHRLIGGVGSGEGMASHIVHLAIRLTSADHVTLWAPDGDRLVLQYGFPDLPPEHHVLGFGPGCPSYEAMAERKTLIFQTAEECARSVLASMMGGQSMLMVPVVDRMHSRALLVATYSWPLQIRPQEIQIMEGLARLMTLVAPTGPLTDFDALGVGEPLFEAISSLVSSDDLDSLLARVMEAALSVSGGHLGYIGLLTADSLHAVTADLESFEMSRDEIFDEATDVGRGPVGQSLRRQRMVVIQDISADPTMSPWLQDMRADGIQAALAIPLMAQGAAVGLLKVYHSHRNGFEVARIRRLEALASLAATVIQKWQSEHDPTQQWLQAKTQTVYNVLPQLLTEAAPGTGYRLVEDTVRQLLDGLESGIVRHEKDTVVPLDDRPIPLSLYPHISAAMAQVEASRCIECCAELDGQESLFLMPFMAEGRIHGALWVRCPADSRERRHGLLQQLNPHLMSLSLAASHSVFLEERGFA